MNEATLLKTLRLRRDTFEALAAIAEEQNRNFDSLCQEALDAWLQAYTEAQLRKEMEEEAQESTLGYDEFWDGVELD
ncbi:hypothetical protein [Nitratifractor salsuginis]|uniref:Uncharacterized protein n=1 Tax=Nitratifractor salsuginis (strain DSM 16511 / JCM 12458 / E9I37-1) TaxID=749222 RepID=E6WZ12_NITSE|nr:hypothetical protein [Nitratifractor salsuginis]ADV45462.1 hypothetical protein Nitsa_0190 [Nitratifractor salsuginis DSM 16511]